MPLNGLIRLVTHLADRSDKADEDIAELLEHMSELSAHICRVWQVNIDGLEVLGLEAKNYQSRRENQSLDDFLSSRGVSVTQIAQARRANTAEAYDLREIEKNFPKPNDRKSVTSAQYADSMLKVDELRKSARSIVRRREEFRKEFNALFDELSDLSSPDIIAKFADADISSLRKQHERMQRQSSKVKALSKRYRATIRN